MSFVSQLLIDLAASWLRLLIALAFSILFSIVIGIAAATNRALERIILPLLDIFQTIPILGFFPIVIFLVVSVIPGAIGINLAVISLIFTSMVWNISFGVYEAVKSIPDEVLELASLNHFTFMERVRRMYIPASIPRIAYQSMISFSIGLFYLATSEIFSTGSANFAVKYGIGVEIANLAATMAPVSQYALAIISFIIAVILTRELIIEPFSIYSEKFSLSETNLEIESSPILKFYRKISAPFVSMLKKIMPPSQTKSKKREITPAAAPLFKGSTIISAGARKHQNLHIYEIKKHRGFRHVYAVIILLLLVLALIILFHIGELSTEISVLYALGASFLRVWFIYLISVLIAVPMGIKVALSKRWFKPSMALLQVLSAIPATILLPAMIVLLAGFPFFGEDVALSVIFIAMVWYILFSVVSGMRTIPESLFEVEKINRLTWKQRWIKIYIPASLPSFVTGSITAIGGAWNSLIVAEYFTVQAVQNTRVLSQVSIGIGKLIDIAVFSGNLTMMAFAIISMTIMVIAINRLFWQKIYNRVTSRYRFEV